MATPSTMRVIDAIKNTYEVLISYRSDDKDVANGTRLIQPVAYGLTKKGNPVIRAFQPDGDTTTKIPAWKFFRVDRIIKWEGYKNSTFEEPPGMFNVEGEFNSSGDKTMSVVYNIANFGYPKSLDVEKSGPITKDGDNENAEGEDDIFKTDTERGMEKLMQQLKTPEMLSQELMSGGGGEKSVTAGPVNKEVEDDNTAKATNDNTEEVTNTNDNENAEGEDDIFKTDTERGMEKLMQQLKTPEMLSQELLNKK